MVILNFLCKNHPNDVIAFLRYHNLGLEDNHALQNSVKKPTRNAISFESILVDESLETTRVQECAEKISDKTATAPAHLPEVIVIE